MEYTTFNWIRPQSHCSFEESCHSSSDAEFQRKTEITISKNAVEHFMRIFRFLYFSSDVVNDKTLFPTNMVYSRHDWHDTIDAVKSIVNVRWKIWQRLQDVSTYNVIVRLVRSPIYS